MKLIIREFLASLREREELDAILPDLLSELGYTIISRPGRDTRQHGVDIAAIGRDDDGQRKIFLFSVKQGDLTRQDWDGTPQALRPSLNEILDAYIPSRIPRRYQNLAIVICLCVGGEILEQVADDVRGYTSKNTTDQVTFDVWNGDRIAGFILAGILREEILPRDLRSSFQKSVAMVDEPDVSYYHFAALVGKLRSNAGEDLATRLRPARQIYVCLWILFVWARDVENLESPYRCSELALLSTWELLKPSIGRRNNNAKALVRALQQLIQLHYLISTCFLDEKIRPHVDKRHAISLSVGSQNAVDVNLALFDLLGRIAMLGLWVAWLAERSSAQDRVAKQKQIEDLVSDGFKLIGQNPTLFCPITDQQAIDIALFLQLVLSCAQAPADTVAWLTHMTDRLDIAVRTHGKYPCVYTEYRDLIYHPQEKSDTYRKEATSGSILIPLLASWLTALRADEAFAKLEDLKRTQIEHCTLQLWLPEELTEDSVYTGGRDHGVALCDLVLSAGGSQLLDEIANACQREAAFDNLSAIATGYWPILLLACRHYRLPVPPHFWITSLRPPETAAV
jgi:hypothetical protein